MSEMNTKKRSRILSVAEQHRQQLAKVEWANDGDHENCVHCDAQFTFLLRRHHCRFCGLIFCANCSCNQVLAVRACDTCYRKTQRKTDTPLLNQFSSLSMTRSPSSLQTSVSSRSLSSLDRVELDDDSMFKRSSSTSALSKLRVKKRKSYQNENGDDVFNANANGLQWTDSTFIRCSSTLDKLDLASLGISKTGALESFYV